MRTGYAPCSEVPQRILKSLASRSASGIPGVIAKVIDVAPSLVGIASESAANASAAPVKDETETAPPAAMAGGVKRDAKRFSAFSILFLPIISKIFDSLSPCLYSTVVV